VGNLYQSSRITGETAWRAIFVASLANLLFKAGVVAVLGGGVLRRRLLPAMGALTAAGVVIVLVWPG
jgi:uncharacterized membrane protein (DUF4010 family)